jgi:hypothetical protein
MTPADALAKVAQVVEGLPIVFTCVYEQNALGEGVVVSGVLPGSDLEKVYGFPLHQLEDDSVASLVTTFRCIVANTMGHARFHAMESAWTPCWCRQEETG